MRNIYSKNYIRDFSTGITKNYTVGQVGGGFVGEEVVPSGVFNFAEESHIYWCFNNTRIHKDNKKCEFCYFRFKCYTMCPRS